ncbi:MAG: acyltransferase [Candidatus Omnitrophica bacterium]|nr:acyltransferase [Candidatus Omnitrophota bacterium]
MNYSKHPTALVNDKSQIGDRTRIWAFVNIQDGAIVGSDCNICDCCFLEKGAKLGNRVTIKNGVSIFDGVILEDDVFCGTNVVFVNDRNPRSKKEDWVLEKTIVKKGATIGSNATVLCGVTIGEYAFVGAGSIVTKDVLPFEMVVGNPARKIGYACCCGKRLEESLKCSCGLLYSIGEKGLEIND